MLKATTAAGEFDRGNNREGRAQDGLEDPEIAIGCELISSNAAPYALSPSMARVALNPLCNLEETCRMVLPPGLRLKICSSGYDEDYNSLVDFLGEFSGSRAFATEARRQLGEEGYAGARIGSPLDEGETRQLAAQILNPPYTWGVPCAAWALAGTDAGVIVLTEAFKSEKFPEFLFGKFTSFIAPSELDLNLFRTLALLHESAHIFEVVRHSGRSTGRFLSENTADAHAAALILKHTDYDPQVLDFVARWVAMRDLGAVLRFTEHAFCGQAVSTLLETAPSRLLKMNDSELGHLARRAAKTNLPRDELIEDVSRFYFELTRALLPGLGYSLRELPDDRRFEQFSNLLSEPVVGEMLNRAARSIYSMGFEVPKVLRGLLDSTRDS